MKYTRDEIKEMITPFDAFNIWALWSYFDTIEKWIFDYKKWISFMKWIYWAKIPVYIRNMLKYVEFDFKVLNSMKKIDDNLKK